MHLELSREELAFRDEVRSFMAGVVPPAWLTRVRAGLRLEPPELIAYQKALAARGWGAPTWPAEHGGPGWTPTQVYIFETEAARAGAPIQFHQGLELIGPIIFTYGDEAQKRRYLPAIVSGDDWWCQGYSEPEAGSDLAALRTTARREGDSYVLNGQKMWTSYAHVATHMFVLARTSAEPRRQEGVSLLLVPMDTPGLRVRPIATMDAKHHTNEVFLDEVRVPAENLVGEEGRGWSYGKVLLDRERMVTAAVAVHLPQTLDGVREAAARSFRDGRPLLEQADFADRLAQLEIEAASLDMLVRRVLAEASQGGGGSGPRGSMIKLRWSDLQQRATALWVEALGPEAGHAWPLGAAAPPADLPYAVQGALYARVTSIYGGSSEIQRDIIARRALSL